VETATNEKAIIGPKDNISPFGITNTGRAANLGFEAKTTSGNNIELLSIHRVSSPYRDKRVNLPNSDSETPLLESFISHLEIASARTLDDLKLKLNSLKSSDNLKSFISYVCNGAFFKHWADHYADQAKRMASSLKLAT
jgi:hypothetical protein